MLAQVYPVENQQGVEITQFFPQCLALSSPPSSALLLRGGGCGGGQDPWGEHNVESDRLATGAQLREKKKSKKKQQKQLKTTHRENILNTCISFYSFLSAPMCSSVCVCVRVFERILGLLLACCCCFGGDTSYKHKKYICLWVADVLQQKHKNYAPKMREMRPTQSGLS